MLGYMEEKGLIPASNLQDAVEGSVTDEEALAIIHEGNFLAEKEDSDLKEAWKTASQKELWVTSELIRGVWKKHQ